MAITIDDIEELRRRLTALPRNQPREVSKQEAIALLASELGAARRRGYSPEELARLLSEQGVAINAATLRGYLRRKRRIRKGRRGTPTAVGAKAASAAQPASSAAADRPAAPSPPPPIARSAQIVAKETAPASAREAQDARGPRDSADVER
jgi:hypothetical protein